jgi:hypothetical protein
MTIRLYKCERCDHKIRLGAYKCGKCAEPTPMINRDYVLATTFVAAIIFILLAPFIF